jgi:GTP-binding protein Era
MSQKKQCGYIAIIGRPNVGKSTLLNHLIQQKISITSKKPQTTRQRILGIKTSAHQQMIYVDTPGLHQNAHRALNRYMNRAATSSVFDVDLILFLVDGLHWTSDDEWALKKIEHVKAPVILVVNKIDKISDKTSLLPHLEILNKKRKFIEVVPLIAKSNQDAEMLEEIITHYLPEKEFAFDADQITDRTERFMAAEIIREKLMRHLGQELPYDLTVEIEEYKVEQQVTRSLLRISAVIYVEKPGQKIIVIGEKGERLKMVGEKARLDMEKLFGEKVFLQLWVKVKRGWSDSERSLQSLGFLH